MDFFRAQEQARRATAWLVFYFIVAVALIIGAVYLPVLLFINGGEPEMVWWQPGLFAATAAATTLLVAGGTLYKISELARGGGAGVAESLGGERVRRDTTVLAERRLLNVVEEMAIASGVPVPPVYVLRREAGINAFAAGHTSGEAVVAVTRGALEGLSRDELQGVIAHEFSHILNGDMRLNLRLMGVLHGILLLAIIGREVMESAGKGRGRGSGGAALFGLALVVIGYVGVFFGRLIKAAVSRQREYLADAAAVQFTRNPAGLGGALKKIAGVAGSLVLHPRAEEASHLFFGEGIHSWFATHPPIGERIRRLDPAFNAELARHADAGAAADGALAFAASAGNVLPEHTDYARRWLAQLPAVVQEQVRTPQGARAVIYALLRARNQGVAHRQGGLIEAHDGQAQRLLAEEIAEALRQARLPSRLPLVDLALPALEQLDEAMRTRFLELTALLVRADGRRDLFEYTLQSILNRHLLERRSGRAAQPRDLHTIRRDCRLLLSALAYTGHRTVAEVSAAFAAGTALAPLDGEWILARRETITLSTIDAALTHLAGLPPRFKHKLVEACAAAVLHDGTVTVGEGDLLRAVCEALEVPIPPLVRAAALESLPGAAPEAARG